MTSTVRVTAQAAVRAYRRKGRFLTRLTRIHVGVTMVYRGNFLIMQLGNLIIPVTSLLVWQAVLAGGAALPVSSRYLTAYFVLVAVVEMLTSSWTAFFLAESIRAGTLNKWLVRPASTHVDAIANNVGEKVVKLVVLLPIVGLTILVLEWTRAGADGLSYPREYERWLAFGIAVVLAAAIRFTLDVLIGSLAFWFEDVQGFLRVRAVVVPVLSGAVVPLALMPAGWGVITQVQPFRFMVSFPMEVLLSDASWRHGSPIGGFALQSAWLAIFVAGSVAVWHRGLRSYSAAGA